MSEVDYAYAKTESARVKRMLEIVSERDSLAKRLAWAEQMLERAKYVVLNSCADIIANGIDYGPLWRKHHAEWLSDLEKGPDGKAD